MEACRIVEVNLILYVPNIVKSVRSLGYWTRSQITCVVLLSSSLADKPESTKRDNLLSPFLFLGSHPRLENHQQSTRDIAHVRHSTVEKPLTQHPWGSAPRGLRHAQSSITVRVSSLFSVVRDTLPPACSAANFGDKLGNMVSCTSGV